MELFGTGKPRDPDEPPFGTEAVGYKHIALLVDSVDEEYARLKALGVEFIMDPATVDSGLRLAFFKDPDGNVLELLQKPE